MRTSAPSRRRKTESSVITTSATPARRERIRALGDDLRLSLRRRRGHGHDHTARAHDEVHRTTDPEHVLSGHSPVRDVAGSRDLKSPEHGDVDVPAADHREALRAVEVGGAGERGHRSLRRVDEVWVELVVARSRPDAEEPVLRVQEDVRVVEQAGDEIRDADAEVDDLAGSKLLRRAGRDQRLDVAASSGKHQLVDVQMRRMDRLRLELAR